MLAEVGSILVGLALATALYAGGAGFWAIHRADSRWAKSGRNAVTATVALLGVALAALLGAFLGDQFQIRYVAQHSGRDLPAHLKASAVWAGQEGSLLLWSFLQALFGALVVARPSKRAHPPERARHLVPWAGVVLNLLTAFFAAVTLLLSNPFARQATIPPDGQGLNPLLRHPGMIFHPPAMYLGYVGLAVPFAFAIAALITRQVDGWPSIARRWTLVAWLFLGLGILLGARWAYDVLGWGGYWGWDPVENAGLMPWLTATALLHGIAMQEQRGGFRAWNMLLAALSFALVLFGTFTTRSGLILSVHAFVRSDLGPYFLAAIFLTLSGSLALVISRRSILASPYTIEGLFSRDGMSVLTLVLLLTITASVFVGSLLPTLTQALAGRRFEAGPAWFDRVTGPQFAALVLVMGVCPLLARVAGGLRRVRRRGLPALLGAIVAAAAAALMGFSRPVSLLGFALAGLAGGTALAEIGRVGARRGVGHGGRHGGRRYGGYLVHFGVILMALGVIGTRHYPFEMEVELSPGEPVDVGAYTLVYDELRQETEGDHLSTWAAISAYRDGDYLATLKPRMDRYPGFDQAFMVPALRTGLREDLYLVLFSSSVDRLVNVKVIVNPLINFLWLGGLVFLGGGLFALWPSATRWPSAARAADVGVRRGRRWPVGTTVALAAGLLVLVVAGVAMWQPGMGSLIGRVGRPLLGQPAPDFTLDLLDGSRLSLADLRGQVVVLNFWTTWCPPCADELPDLEALWSEYQARGVVFVGIAVQEEKVEVREMGSQFGLTYPLGLDPEERIAAPYGITGVPETFVIDPQGQMAAVHVGSVDARELRQDLDRLLGR